MNKLSPIRIQLLIFALATLFFVPFLGIVHLFDWDEVNFAESAREMIVSGDYLTVQINFQPFWEKPPLFIWMQVVSMKFFGINEFAARFPNAVCGIVTLLVLFNIGRKIKDNLFGILWVLAYAGSLMPFFYFKSGIIDPWFNLFIFLGIYFLILYAFPENKYKLRNIVLSALFTGLAILTKGPVGFLVILLTGFIYLIFIRFKIRIKTREVITYILVLTITGGLWFIIQVFKGNYDTIREFVMYQIRLFKTEDAGHGGFFGFHFIILLIGVFPSSVFALKSFRKEEYDESLYQLVRKWMLILFWVVIVLFTIVQTKIVHYSSLTYFPISFLAANFIYNTHFDRAKWSKWQSVMTIAIAFLVSLPIIFAQFLEKYKEVIIEKNLIRDALAIGNLQAEARWSGFEFLLGFIPLALVLLVFLFLNKKQILQRAVLLWCITFISVFLNMNLLIPKIEKYTQGALIEFFESKKGKDVYLKAINFKSYAIFFYSDIQPPENELYYDNEWLLTGNIDKDVYVVTKTHKAYQIEGYPELKKLHDKNGYSFYVREAK